MADKICRATACSGFRPVHDMHILEKASHLSKRSQSQEAAPQGGPAAEKAHLMSSVQARSWPAEIAEAPQRDLREMYSMLTM